MQIKLIYQVELEEYLDRLLEFYQPRFEENYEKILKNSTMICFCLDDNEVVGAGRVLSDLKRNALVVDLVVKKDKRNKGIGTKIMNAIVKECKNLNIRQISLQTDPQLPWLLGFYEKFGFKKLEKGYYMINKK